MKIGVALAQSSWPDGRVWSFAEIVDYAERADRLGFDSVWTNDHFFLELGAPRRPSGPEPMVLLAHLAARTERVQLGTLVLCAPFRDPGQLVRESKTLAELSGGRFILGLGCGWHEPEFQAFGIPSDHLVSRFEEYVEAVMALLRGGEADYDGRYVRLRRAEVSGGAVPPVWIAARGPRMLRITARHADGWNLPGPRDSLAEVLALLREEIAAAGRPEGAVVVSNAAIVLLDEPEEAGRLLAEHPGWDTVAVGADGLRAVVDTQRAAGCDHLILHLSGTIWSSYGPEQLDLAADALGL